MREILRQRRGDGNQGRAGGDVECQHRPQKIPMRRAKRLGERQLRAGRLRPLRRRRPARRRVMIRRRPQELSCGHHDQEVAGAQQHQSALDALSLDQRRRQRARDEGAKSEPGHRQPSDEAALVWEPSDQDGERDDIAKAEADAAQNFVRQVERGQVGCETGQENARSIQDTRRGGDRAWPEPALEVAANFAVTPSTARVMVNVRFASLLVASNSLAGD